MSTAVHYGIQELEIVKKVFTTKISVMKDIDLNHTQRLQKLSLEYESDTSFYVICGKFSTVRPSMI